MCTHNDESSYLRLDQHTAQDPLAQMTCPWVWREVQSRHCFLSILRMIAVIVPKLYQNVHCYHVCAQWPVIIFEAESWHVTSFTGSNKLPLGMSGHNQDLAFCQFWAWWLSWVQSYTKMHIDACAQQPQHFSLHDIQTWQFPLSLMLCHMIHTCLAFVDTKFCMPGVMSEYGMVMEKQWHIVPIVMGEGGNLTHFKGRMVHGWVPKMYVTAWCDTYMSWLCGHEVWYVWGKWVWHSDRKGKCRSTVL